MNSRYILEGKVYREEPDLLAWGKWFEDISNRKIKYTKLRNGKIVSTVFLGLCHNFSSKGRPILFETLELTEQQIMIRDDCYNDAVESHNKLVKELQDGNSNKGS